MTETKSIPIDTEEFEEFTPETIRGVRVDVRVSPYDLPQAFRGFYVENQGVFRIEFRYIDNEGAAKKRQRVDDVVSFEIGEHSSKLLAIEVEVDQHDIKTVELSVQLADQAVSKLKARTLLPNARLNYAVIQSVLEKNRRNPALFAAI